MRRLPWMLKKITYIFKYLVLQQNTFLIPVPCGWFAVLFLSCLPFLQVVNWLEGPGSEQLRTQWGIGDSIRASQALQQKHEEIESQHSVRLPLSFSSSKTVLSAFSYVFCILVTSIEELDSEWFYGWLSKQFKSLVRSLYVDVILFSGIEKY